MSANKIKKEMFDMAGLIPFNRRNVGLARQGAGFEDFYNMIDDFFTDGALPGRNLLRDTFKIDIAETENEFVLEAELPGVKKDEINLNIEDDNLCITVNRSEEANKNGKNFIHRERRVAAMSRRIRLSGTDLDAIKAKLEDGVLFVTIPKNIKTPSARKIDIE